MKSIYILIVFIIQSCLAFHCFIGKYKVLYPIKKIIKFTEANNEIIERSLLHLKFHEPNRMFFTIKHLDDDHFLLINIFNSSDIMFLQHFYKR